MNQNIFENTMAEMTWPEIEALAAEGALVLLPVGVIEEHGEHLPLGTDTYLAYAKARDIVAGMQELGLPCVIAPSYCFGVVSTVTKNFPGSFTAKPEHVQSIITDILESIENAGFKNVLLQYKLRYRHGSQPCLFRFCCQGCTMGELRSDLIVQGLTTSAKESVSRLSH